MEEKEGKAKSGWYPGKYVSGRRTSSIEEKKSVEVNEPDTEESEDKDKKGWYPGKYATKAARRVSVATTSEPAERRFSTKPNISSPDSFSDLVSDSPSEKRKPQFEGLETIGKVRVRLPGIRYINMAGATFIVELEDFAAFFDYNPDTYVEFDRTFEIKDISSDIVITISGNSFADGSNIAGVIVVPLVSLLGFSGKPNPPKEIWRQVYPVYSKSKGETFRFTSGFSDPQGYALTKPKQYLGFVSMVAELNLYHNPLKTYFFGEPRFHMTEYVLELLSDQEQKTAPIEDNIDEALSLALVNRNFQRLHNVALPLACLSPVLNLPEVFILVGVFGFFCFSLHVYQLPIFIVCFALFNGIYTMLNRSYSKVLIWNDSVFIANKSNDTSPTPHNSQRIRSVSLADASNMQATLSQLTGAIAAGTAVGTTAATPHSSANTQKTVYSVYSRHLHAVVHYLEVISNLFNFADSRVSVIWYGILFIFAMLTSLFLSIFSFRALLLLLVASALLLYAGRDVVYDYFYFKIKSSKENKAVKVMKHLTMLNCFFSKVPDELDLIHRYIAGTAIVNEKGAEMLDASVDFKK